jgi:hypothetical protein
MFNDSIRGGQVSLHKIAMFKQILAKASSWACIPTIDLIKAQNYKFQESN